MNCSYLHNTLRNTPIRFISKVYQFIKKKYSIVTPFGFRLFTFLKYSVTLQSKVKIKVKFTLEQAVKAQRGEKMLSSTQSNIEINLQD